MIRLKNIKREGNIVKCNIIPEDSKEPGRLVVDVDKEEIIDYELPKGYEWCRSHVGHAFWAIIDGVKSNNLPEERLVMWY